MKKVVETPEQIPQKKEPAKIGEYKMNVKNLIQTKEAQEQFPAMYIEIHVWDNQTMIMKMVDDKGNGVRCDVIMNDEEFSLLAKKFTAEKK
jgi:hypothetical protein